MHKIFSKILSVICIAVMLFGVLSVPSYALENEEKYFFVSNVQLEAHSQSNVILQNNRIIVVSLLEEEVSEVPLYNQLDYPHIPYGNYGSVASHGCGITCLSMVATYLLNDRSLTPDALAKQFGKYNTESGSYHILFEDSAEVLGLDLQERTYDTEKVMEALNNGQVVIALQGRGLFTGGGHFIVLTGVNEQGLITVNDPNGANYYKNRELIEGFEEGFTERQVFADGGPYWIYAKKDAKNMHFLGDSTLFNKFSAMLKGFSFAKVYNP